LFICFALYIPKFGCLYIGNFGARGHQRREKRKDDYVLQHVFLVATLTERLGIGIFKAAL
jgi:hypothetical protein